MQNRFGKINNEKSIAIAPDYVGDKTSAQISSTYQDIEEFTSSIVLTSDEDEAGLPSFEHFKNVNDLGWIANVLKKSIWCQKGGGKVTMGRTHMISAIVEEKKVNKNSNIIIAMKIFLFSNPDA